MTIITLICIVSCVFIICLFTFFTIVYRSELKREKQLRDLLIQETKGYDYKAIPVMLMDMPKQEKTTLPSVSKDKKDIN